MSNSVLVVIPALNEAAHIANVLRQLMVGLTTDRNILFVVADGGSSDGTQEIVISEAKRLPLRVELLNNTKKLQSAGVNLAVQRFGRDFDILVRCDAHSEYPEGFIENLVNSMHRNAADAVVVPMDSIGDSPLQRAIAWISDTPLGSGGSAHRGGKVSGFVDHGHHAGFMMRSFVKAGGYDETFSHNEDAELDCRQRALGSRIYLDSSIRIGYYPREKLAQLGRQYFKYGEGRSKTIRRHPGSWRVRQLAVPANLVLCLVCCVVATAWPLALLWPALYLLACLSAGALLSARHQSLAALLCGPAAILMHQAWAIGFLSGLMRFDVDEWVAGSNVLNVAIDN